MLRQARLFFIIITLFILPRGGEGFVLRIGLINDQSSVKLSTTGYCDLIDLSTDKVILTTYGWMDGLVEVRGNGLFIRGLNIIRGPLLIRPIIGAIARVNQKPYRGEIEVARTEAGLQVVNIIDLEEYLYGILKCEMDVNAPLEALKAQAVIARTFALANINKHKDRGYHLCDSIHCQVYEGVRAEDPIVIKAVDSTSGQVLTYGEEMAQTFYHASCGGWTADALSVWAMEIPYLHGVACPFCQRASKSHYWQTTFKITDIQKALNRNGLKTGEISALIPVSSNPGRQRAETIIIQHSQGETKINSNKFRLLLGSTRIWSTNFSVVKGEHTITFRGIGKGHGVGLCQWGARVMADLGYNYKQILGFYYPGLYLRSIVFEEDE